MNIKELLDKRLLTDNKLDGFSDFVEVGKYRNLRIVRRDAGKWLGLIDNADNVVIPLLYDNIQIVKYGLRLKIIDGEGTPLFGWANKKDISIIIEPTFKALYPLEEEERIWCLDVNNYWSLYDLDGIRHLNLPFWYKPLDATSGICVLCKNDNEDFSVECWDKNEVISQRSLRNLALKSELPGRIILKNEYYNLIVYCDIYGRVLHSNINLNRIFTNQ